MSGGGCLGAPHPTLWGDSCRLQNKERGEKQLWWGEGAVEFHSRPGLGEFKLAPKLGLNYFELEFFYFVVLLGATSIGAQALLLSTSVKGPT